MALLFCLPNVEILESQAVGGRAFERLLSYAHEHMGDSPDELPVLLYGQFRSAGNDERKRHSIVIEQFRPGLQWRFLAHWSGQLDVQRSGC